ncbi:ser thr kinase [Stylonychia lemnae]|uniref:Casein kinase I n=1 Tax=Stylonychia lemnae TaxID=5949 RepID=A0A078B8R5_STYLE|nr:ser thr kinase [Stylonychia lemnae]|eukprot:CDW89928.1 ser thr kinase [Stylonychia lemnae]
MQSSHQVPVLPRSKINNQYILKDRIGAGSFGQIYRGYDQENKRDVAIKLVLNEAKVLKHINTKGGKLNISFFNFLPMVKHYFAIGSNLIFPVSKKVTGFPKLYWFGREGDFNLMVIELLGRNLDETLKFCGRRFSLETVLQIADQLPENFCLGYGTSKANQVYMIDLGLSKRYRDSKRRTHIPQANHRGLTGTARYASINAHLAQSRRDDMESIGYVLVYLIKGELPWQGVKAQTKHEKYQMIMERKMSLTSELLCQGLPDEFQSYLQQVMDLGFEEKPNYEFYRQQFRQLARRGGFDLKAPQFDWILIKEMRKRQREEKKKNNHQVENYEEEVKIKSQRPKDEQCLKSHNKSERPKMQTTHRIDFRDYLDTPVDQVIQIFEDCVTFQIERDLERFDNRKLQFLERLSRMDVSRQPIDNNDAAMSVESEVSMKESVKYLDTDNGFTQGYCLDIKTQLQYHNSLLCQEPKFIDPLNNQHVQWKFVNKQWHGNVDLVYQKISSSDEILITNSSDSSGTSSEDISSSNSDESGNSDSNDNDDESRKVEKGSA